jgi:hypothetical protein
MILIDRLEEAILLCAESRSMPDHVGRLRDMFSDPALDLDRLWQRAEKHAIQPLVAQTIGSSTLSDIVPSRTYRAAKDVRIQTLLRNCLLAQELERVSAVLGAHDIPVTPLKGTHFTQRVFESLDARHCGDIDLLVPEAQWQHAWDLLLADGYQPTLSGSRPGVKYHSFHGVPLISHRFGIECCIELHWKLSDPRFLTIDYDHLWQRIRSRRDPQQFIYPLPTDELLIYLALHIHKHNTGVLRLIVDIDRLLIHESDQLDWEHVVWLARRWHAAGLAYFALRSAMSLFSAPIPNHVLERLRPATWTCGLVEFWWGTNAILNPPSSQHLAYYRCTLAYCVMLSPPIRILHAFRQYVMAVPRSVDEDRRGSPIGRIRRLLASSIWTSLAVGSALKDWRRRGEWSSRCHRRRRRDSV